MLLNLLGASRAMEMMLSGEMIDAAEAERTGLVSRVIPEEELLDEAKELARKLMRGAPLAQRAIKECMYKALYEPDGLETYNTLVEAALAETGITLRVRGPTRRRGTRPGLALSCCARPAR